VSTPELTRVKSKIAAAFADLPQPEPGEIACDCVSKTCEGLAMDAEFKPHSWQTVPAALIDKYAQSLPIFTDPGYQYYLPAYMMRALENPDSEVWEACILGLPGSGAGSALMPPLAVHPGDSINQFQKVTELLEAYEEERLNDFTVPQIDAMIEFVEYLIAHPTSKTNQLIEELFSRSECLSSFLDAQKQQPD
jgi:hypothetical protein